MRVEMESMSTNVESRMTIAATADQTFKRSSIFKKVTINYGNPRGPTD
jgi:hypothetical protein